MENDIAHSISLLPLFLSYFALALVLTGVFIVVYLWITPHKEIALIRAGNEAAAISFRGALLGFVVPLALAIAHAQSILDCAVWGFVALVVQVLTFLVVRLFLPHLSERISADERAAGIFLAGISLAVGILNAACMTY